MIDLSALGATSCGVWSRGEALALLTSGQIAALVADGVWQVVFRGVYADGGYELTAEQWAHATVLATGGAGQPLPFGEHRADGSRPVRIVAAACGRTAARVWELPLIDDDDPATAGSDRFVHDVHTWRALPHVTRPARPGDPLGHQLRRHQLTLFDGDLVQHPSGLWLTSPLRTALDCVTLLGHEAGVCALDAALHRRMFTPADLDAAIAARAGHPGVRALARAAAAADGRAESPNETLARLILLPALPGLEPQVTLRDRRGQVMARFDLGDVRLRLAVEMDGKRGHAGAAMVAKDRRRDRRSEGEGWWTERGTWFEVRRQQAAFRERIVARARVLGERAA